MTVRQPTQPKLPLTLHLGDQKLKGCFFFRKTPQQIPPPQPRSGSWGKHVFTLPNYVSIRDTLLQMIESAHETVLFASFLLADQQVVTGLIEAAERNHGGVYILTQLEKDLRPLFHDEEETEALERQEQHQELLEQLAKSGVALRSHNEMHAKFCVVDWENALVTSANAAPTSYEKNHENGFLLYDSTEVQKLATLFSNIWRHQTHRESPPTPSGLIVRPVSHPRPKKKFQIKPTSSHEKSTRIIWTYLNDAEQHHLYNELLRLIRMAQKELLIATYSFTDLPANHRIQQELKKAVQRGVHVEMVLWVKNLPVASQESLQELLRNKKMEYLLVVGKNRTHAKAIITDNKEALLFTGNFDGNHGLTSGIEVGITTREPEAVAAIQEYVQYLVASAESELIVNPTLEAMALINAINLRPLREPLTILLNKKRLENFVPQLIRELESQLVLYQTISVNDQPMMRFWTEKESKNIFLEGPLRRRESVLQSEQVVSIDKIAVRKSKDWKPDGFIGPTEVTIEFEKS